MNPTVIPSFDAIALPAPVWLMQFLSALTFVLHVIPMNIVLGGGILAVVLGWVGKSRSNVLLTRLSRQLAAVLPVTVAMSITLGVPPLLFLQTLYGPLFYTSSILIAWPWLTVIGLLLVGYYCYYYFALRKGDGHVVPALLVGAAGCLAFVGIAFLYTSNMTLMILPENFVGIHRSWTNGFLPFVNDAMVLPRYLHFLVAAVAVSGLALMVVGLLQSSETHLRSLALQVGGFTFVGATIVQFVVGIWFLLALRRPVLMQFMGQDTIATAIFGSAFFLSVLALAFILVAALGKKPLAMTISGIGTISLTIVLMTIMRSIVRDAYLGRAFVVADQPSEPVWSVIAIFFVLFAAGLALVGWMVHAVVTGRGKVVSAV
jgi:hypothetical protein